MSQFQQVVDSMRTDSGFRKRVLRNPMRALAAYGLTPDECGLLHTLAQGMAAVRPPRQTVVLYPCAPGAPRPLAA